MRSYPYPPSLFAVVFSITAFLLIGTDLHAHPTTALQGRVADSTDAAVTGASIIVRNLATSLERVVQTDSEGNYQVPALPIGVYRVEVRAPGFQTQIVEGLTIEVGRSAVQDFQLRVGDLSNEMTVTPSSQAVERTTISVGQILDQRIVQEAPLNGRYFIDLGLLAAGSVTPPQGAFSAAPMRGLGSLAFITAGNREETVNYIINGITLNNLTFSSISFQPSINTIQEFRVESSTFSAEFGQSSGAIVNIATRSGSNDLHVELFEFFRNDALDARNFFQFTSSKPAPFNRNQFGGNLGGPIIKEKTLFFFSYEGLRQRQELNLNSVVLTDAERASTNNPVVARLVELVPRANFIDQSGTPRFIGSASAPVDVNQWTVDISHSLSKRDILHIYYAIQQAESKEPATTGNTIAGFGNVSRPVRQIFTLNETHTFGRNRVNQVRFGFNQFSSSTTPNAQLNPAEFGINNGISEPIGLPQINIAGGSLNFGGPANNPSGRSDTTFVVADMLSAVFGKRTMKFGGEYRQFLNNNFRKVTGSFNFPSVSDFLAGTANSFTVTLGNQSSSIAEGALNFFAQDNYRMRPNLTIELGLRYEWNMAPSERFDRFIVFDPLSTSLVRVGAQIDEVYHHNNKNFQPRFGFAWDPFKQGKTAVRGAYAILVDQPMTSIVTPTSANPPLAIPLTFSGSVRFDNAINLARSAGLSPQSVDHDFDNAYVQSWNLNVQRELTPDLAVMAGYFGSKGTQLITRRNINQPLNGARPFPSLSNQSPILPGVPLGNITQVESSGNSSYTALWVTANHRLRCGLQFNASYSWSKSLDYTSFSTGGIVVQNSYDLRRDRGRSDFDVRHRFVVSVIYKLPVRGNRLVEGWQLAAIMQSQSGNPFNIVTSNSTVNGLANTLRPDVTGPIKILGSADRWFDTSVFTAATSFGNLGRNVVVGPAFNNVDFSIVRNARIGDRIRAQLRAEFFNLFNHANLGRPGNVVGAPAFGRITSTRLPTGESGSSRQIQLVLKLTI
jgi:hypothetical protein